MSTLSSLDVAGRRRSATYSQFHRGRAPRNRACCPADPPSVKEIVAVMRRPGDGLAGDRMRGADRRALARAACGSRRRSTSTSATSTRAAARC